MAKASPRSFENEQWVTYSDYQAALAAKDEEIERLKELADQECARADAAERALDKRMEEIERLKEEVLARAWNAQGFTCETCNRVVPWESAKPGLYSPLCPYCDNGNSGLLSAEAIQRSRVEKAEQERDEAQNKADDQHRMVGEVPHPARGGSTGDRAAEG